MPSLGADMTEGTLTEWLVHPGDVVHRGDVIAVVDTVKSAIDIEVFEEGRVEELLVEPGTSVPVGTPLARLASVNGSVQPEPTDPESTEPESPEPETPTTVETTRPSSPPSPVLRHLAHDRGVDLSTVQGTGPDGTITRSDVEHTARPVRADRLQASPYARRRAGELEVDLATVHGTGPDGAVTVSDVEAAAGPAPPPEPVRAPAPAHATAPAPQQERAATAAERAAAMRNAIGDLMARSKREIPHYYLETTIDLGAATEWLERFNADRPSAERVLPVALMLKAAAIAARDVRGMNGFFVDGAFQRSTSVHLGVAVSLRGGGLVAPAIHDTDRLSVPDLMVALKDLVARARAGRLRGSEMSDPTLTVTNLGEQGAEAVHGVIYPPQVALLGLGRVVERPWAVDRMLTVRPLVTATLAADHRVTDGHLGSLFLAAVNDALQRPEDL
ncbi:MAG TPA: dihydrolipoamide acetyltransferase family protein [Candidatus Limnocylindria bacterium]|nr:dihydrolipoamide acetyltransferase family protein [Candidatus Limnocylindria bacterium]